jgi:VWFA-related protein
MRRKILTFSLSLLLSTLPLLSQQTSPITLNVAAVNLLATVRDKHGNIVRNLSKDDFTLQQDGKPQTITYFAKESNLPLTLGLLVDTSLSQRRVLDQERSASHSFLDSVLRGDKDKAFLVHFDREVELLQELTSSREKLFAAIDQLHTPQFSKSGSGGSGDGDGDGHGSRGHGHGGGTLLYDSIYLASDELMKKQQGRKALIILTDGVDRGSKESLAEAIESAQRADTLIYCILFADKENEGGHGGGGGFGGPRMGGGGMGGGMGGGGMGGGRGGGYPRRTEESRPDGKKILEQIAKTSGGRCFEVSKKETLEKIYADLDEELHNQYVLGYSPDKPDATPGYHKLHLAVKQKDAQVQTREGFYLDH